MPIDCKINGEWKSAEAKVKANGAWKDADEILVKINGVWKDAQNYKKAFLITNTQGTLTLKFIEGMSWKTWADSSLNKIGADYDSHYVIYNGNPIGLDRSGFHDVKPSDLITEITYFED